MRLGSLSAMLFRLLFVPIDVGKLDTLPRPGLRVNFILERDIDVRLSASLLVEVCTGAGVGVGVGESSVAAAGGGGGLDVPEVLTLAVAETGESSGVPLVADSAA